MYYLICCGSNNEFTSISMITPLRFEFWNCSQFYCLLTETFLECHESYKKLKKIPIRWVKSTAACNKKSNQICLCCLNLVISNLNLEKTNALFLKRPNNDIKDNVTFYLPRPLHFLSYQSNRLLIRSDLHSKNFWHSNSLNDILFFKPKTIIVDLTAKF
jgi:hypothetical protein